MGEPGARGNTTPTHTMVGWTFRPGHDDHRSTPFRAPPPAMSQSRARRAFYIALARSRSDMLAVAQDVWDRMLHVAESTSEAGVADDTAKRTALSLLQTLARGEFDRGASRSARWRRSSRRSTRSRSRRRATSRPSARPRPRAARGAAARGRGREHACARYGSRETARARLLSPRTPKKPENPPLRYAAEMAGAPARPRRARREQALLPEEIRRLLRRGRPSIGFFEGRGGAKDQLVWDALHGFRPTPRPDPSAPGALDGRARPSRSRRAQPRVVPRARAWGAGPGEAARARRSRGGRRGGRRDRDARAREPAPPAVGGRDARQEDVRRAGLSARARAREEQPVGDATPMGAARLQERGESRARCWLRISTRPPGGEVPAPQATGPRRRQWRVKYPSARHKATRTATQDTNTETTRRQARPPSPPPS